MFWFTLRQHLKQYLSASGELSRVEFLQRLFTIGIIGAGVAMAYQFISPTIFQLGEQSPALFVPYYTVMLLVGVFLFIAILSSFARRLTHAGYSRWWALVGIPLLKFPILYLVLIALLFALPQREDPRITRMKQLQKLRKQAVQK